MQFIAASADLSIAGSTTATVPVGTQAADLLLLAASGATAAPAGWSVACPASSDSFLVVFMRYATPAVNTAIFSVAREWSMVAYRNARIVSASPQCANGQTVHPGNTIGISPLDLPQPAYVIGLCELAITASGAPAVNAGSGYTLDAALDQGLHNVSMTWEHSSSPLARSASPEFQIPSMLDAGIVARGAAFGIAAQSGLTLLV